MLDMPPMKNLHELNLRKNFIGEIKSIDHLTSLQRLYLSNNKITTMENLTNMPQLSEITLENNPIDKDRDNLRILRT